MKTLSLRLPDGLHAGLVAAAEADRRSLNAEIVVLLELALDGRNEGSGDGQNESG